MTAVGFIGLGTMGREMAANLVRHGHHVRGYDVSAEALAACPDLGVTPAAIEEAQRHGRAHEAEADEAEAGVLGHDSRSAWLLSRS